MTVATPIVGMTLRLERSVIMFRIVGFIGAQVKSAAGRFLAV
jgi:hypothetical protein